MRLCPTIVQLLSNCYPTIVWPVIPSQHSVQKVAATTRLGSTILNLGTYLQKNRYLIDTYIDRHRINWIYLDISSKTKSDLPIKTNLKIAKLQTMLVHAKVFSTLPVKLQGASIWAHRLTGHTGHFSHTSVAAPVSWCFFCGFDGSMAPSMAVVVMINRDSE